MKTLIIPILTFLILSQPVIADVFIDGKTLVKSIPEYEKAEARDPSTDYQTAAMIKWYTLGVVDTLLAADSKAFKLPPNVKTNQVVAVVVKFLKEHPERWNESAVLLVAAALTKSFPYEE